MAVVVLCGCAPNLTGPGANPTGPPVPSVPGAVPRPDHIVIVIFENTAYQQVIGAAAAPYLTSLARTGANFTDAHGEAYPSQPNYLCHDMHDCRVAVGDTWAQQHLPAYLDWTRTHNSLLIVTTGPTHGQSNGTSIG